MKRESDLGCFGIGGVGFGFYESVRGSCGLVPSFFFLIKDLSPLYL